MGQAASLYRMSNEAFEKLKKEEKKDNFDFNAHSRYVTTFEGSFMALEYILAKGQDHSVKELISEIFSPKQSFGGLDLSGATTDDEIDLLLKNSSISIPYLEPPTISKINDFLDIISEAEIHSKYDAKELNENGIYPWVWHDDNASNKVYNQRQIIEDTTALKSIFKKSCEAKDYILVFIG